VASSAFISARRLRVSSAMAGYCLSSAATGLGALERARLRLGIGLPEDRSLADVDAAAPMNIASLRSAPICGRRAPITRGR
jgi:hypothetical protein